MSTEPTPEQIAAWQSFLMAHATVIRTLEQEMEEEQGLPLVWYDVLAQLDHKGRQLRLRALADSVLLSRSNITRLVDRMASAGLVKREPCPEDRRGMYAVITHEGRDGLRRAWPGHWRGIVEHFIQHLNHEDVKALHAALSKVLQAEISCSSQPLISQPMEG
jgi:DNA-binding MarR family transcriptional regulator